MESYFLNRRKTYQFYLIILCAHRNLQEKNGDTKKAVRIKSSNVNKDMINFEEVTRQRSKCYKVCLSRKGVQRGFLASAISQMPLA